MIPIALFVFNRPAHTMRTLAALALNVDASEFPLYVFSDGPRNSAERTVVEDVRQVCRGAVSFAKVVVVERNANMGLAQNIISGVGELMETYKEVIVLEDDLITSPGFLPFMKSTLNRYRYEPVWSVCGYCPPIRIPKTYRYSSFMAHRNGSWGWATWKDRWDRVDWEMKGFDGFFASAKSRHRFAKAGNDLPMMLLKQKLGLINSWSIRFCFEGFQQNLPTVYPVASLVSNQGADGSGTNMKKSSKYAVKLVQNINARRLCSSGCFDGKISRSFRRFYNTSMYRQMINRYKIIKYLIA